MRRGRIIAFRQCEYPKSNFWIRGEALRHRIAGNYAAQANGLGSEQLLDMLLEAVPADKVYARPAA